MTRLTIVFGLCAALAGCFEEDAEKAFRTCSREIEQTILLRQFALSAEKKHLLEVCLTERVLKPEYCRAVYMNEHEALRDCMEDRGYSFPATGSLADHFDATCYRPTWLLKIEFWCEHRSTLLLPLPSALVDSGSDRNCGS